MVGLEWIEFTELISVVVIFCKGFVLWCEDMVSVACGLELIRFWLGGVMGIEFFKVLDFICIRFGCESLVFVWIS